MALHLILYLLHYHQQVPLELQEPLGASGSSQSPPPPPPPSNTQGGQSISTAAPSSSKTAASAKYIAWTMTNTRIKPSVSPIPKELPMGDDTTADEQAYSSTGEDVGRDHIPTVNLRQSWWKPITEDRPATPEPASHSLFSLSTMASLQFCDTHNMVVYLKKSEGSEDEQLKTFTEASLRRHLKLEDADGISSLPNTEIFEQLALMGKTLRHKTEVPQPSSPSQTHDADEAASIRVDVRLGGAATTVSSLDVGQGSGNIDKTPSMPHDSPLPGGHTPRSDEGGMQQNELMDLVTKLSNKVLVLETNLKETKKVYSTAFTKLIMKVKKLKKIVKSNKARRRAKFIVSDDEEDLEDSSKQGRRIADIDQDSDISLVHHDADIQGRYEDISTTEFNISTAKPVSTVGVAVTTASVSTAEPIAPSTTTIKTYTRTTRGVTIREPSSRQRLSP
ncbi:hypothetical protein Tco_1265226 [Tanacetum coccineum]